MIMNKNIFVACDFSKQKEIIDLLSKIHENISGYQNRLTVYNSPFS